MMVALVYLRENWRVVKQHAMEQIFDQCPTNQSAAVDERANHGLRRDQTAIRQQRSDENERRKKQELGKITELAHFHDKTPEALVLATGCRPYIRRPLSVPRHNINDMLLLEERFGRKAEARGETPGFERH